MVSSNKQSWDCEFNPHLENTIRHDNQFCFNSVNYFSYVFTDFKNAGEKKN